MVQSCLTSNGAYPGSRAFHPVNLHTRKVNIMQIMPELILTAPTSTSLPFRRISYTILYLKGFILYQSVYIYTDIYDIYTIDINLISIAVIVYVYESSNRQTTLFN